MAGELLLDLDQRFSPCRWAAWCDRAAWVLKVAKVRVNIENVRVRETDRGYHVYLPIYTGFSGPLFDVTVVALQSLLGSDWNREAFNLQRALDGEPDWNILFNEKKVVGGIASIETPAPEKERMLRETLRVMRAEEPKKNAKPTTQTHQSGGTR